MASQAASLSAMPTPLAVKKPDLRLAALRRFAGAITILTIVGHLVLGFETSYAHPIVAVLTAYLLELGLELLDARLTHRAPAFPIGGGFGSIVSGIVDFLLPAHITALACAMLLYPGETFTPLIFAVAVGVCTKHLFRAPLGRGKTSHFLNPSNTGILVTLVAFHWVNIAPPYQFTENVWGVWDWIIPLIVVTTGTLLNFKLTGKMPLILAWVGGFALQAILRSLFLNFDIFQALSPMTGMAFVLFTFYMVSDPGTTPFRVRNQIVFGLSVAAVYGFLDVIHVVYQIFGALFIVCCTRGALLHVIALASARREALARPALWQPNQQAAVK
jgi:enediyne biosynthesis protein E5